MIQLKKVSFDYAQILVFDQLNLEVSQGSIIGLLGPNGVGKTTLLQLLTGLYFPSSGTIRVLDHEPRLRKKAYLSQMSYLPEELPEIDLTIKAYGELIGSMYPNYDQVQFMSYLSAFHLDEEAILTNLSAGMKRKAFVSLTLSLQTPIVFLDEPTKEMDIDGQKIFRQILVERQHQNYITVIATHHIRELEQLFDHVFIMDKRGHVVINKPVDELSQVLSLKDVATLPDETTYLTYKRAPYGYRLLCQVPSTEATDIPLELVYQGFVGGR